MMSTMNDWWCEMVSTMLQIISRIFQDITYSFQGKFIVVMDLTRYSPYSLQDIALYSACKIDKIKVNVRDMPRVLYDRYKGYKSYIDEEACMTWSIDFKRSFKLFDMTQLKEKYPEWKVYPYEACVSMYNIGSQMTLSAPYGPTFDRGYVHHTEALHISKTDVICYLQKFTEDEIKPYDIDHINYLVGVSIPIYNNFYELVYYCDGKIEHIYDGIEVVRKKVYCSDLDICKDIVLPSGIMIYIEKRTP